MFPTATESIFFFITKHEITSETCYKKEREKLGWNGGDVNKHLGKATTGGGTFATIASNVKPREHRVYPTKKDWLKLQEVMKLPKYEDVVYKFNIQMGLTDVWDDINFYDRSLKKIHSTQKPISLIDRLILTSSNKNDKVLDIFCGSGTTAVSALKNKRKFFGCEADKDYFKKSLKRIQNPNNDEILSTSEKSSSNQNKLFDA